MKMTKRGGNFDEISSKKPKLDDLWDDELDPDAIEDCFQLASQVIENQEITRTQLNNVSIFPNYSAFKAPNNMFTSTQLNNTRSITMVASSSSHHGTHALEARIKQLQQKYEEKEGEVSILRSNLREAKASSLAEQEKRQNEWREKLNLAQKEMKSIQSELSFKNLEVANLKQKIAELNKMVVSTSDNNNRRSPVKRSASSAAAPQNNSSSTLQTTATPQKLRKEDVPAPVIGPKIEINSLPWCPLRSVDFSPVFRLSKNDKFQKKRKTMVPFQSESEEESKPCLQTVVVNGRPLDVDYIYPELSTLIGYSSQELGSHRSSTLIGKIISTGLQFLMDFCQALKLQERDIQMHEIQEADSAYLDSNNKTNFSSNKASFRDELGGKSAKILFVIAELLPYSSYLSDFIVLNKSLLIDKSSDYAKSLPCILAGDYRNVKFLNTVLDIIVVIGKVRKAQTCSSFLFSVIRLVSAVFRTNDEKSAITTICKIVQELLLSRPDFDVIVQLSELFRIASVNSTFVDFLCSRPTTKKAKINNTKGIVYFTQDSCPFHVFAVLLENMLSKIDDFDPLPGGLTNSVLGFIYNVFEANSIWLTPQETTECECLCHLYKLAIGIIHRTVEQLRRAENSKRPLDEEENSALRSGINVLNLLVFNSYYLVEKYITVYGQFRDVLSTLVLYKDKFGLSENDLNELDRLSLNDGEEIPTVEPEAFRKIEF